MSGAFVVIAALMPLPARAQHADAGVEQRAATPPPVEPPAPSNDSNTSATGNEPSGVLPKLIDPNQLSEGTRARLAERAAGRHASSLPAREPAPRQEASQQGAPGPVPPYRPRISGAEALQGARGRTRVQALETDEGVTLLSNRIQLSESRISAAVAKQPRPPAPEPPVVEETVATADSPSITETRSLRPLSSRSAKAKDASTGLGWLLWPFVLFVTTGAVVGTLWFRKKTD
jgi:hypothetical protein